MPQITNSPNFGDNTPKKYKIEYFRGIDISNQPSNVDKHRGCVGLNMIRDVPGKVRKRTGFFRLRTYPKRINGVFPFKDKVVIHSGKNLYMHGMDSEEPVLISGAEENCGSCKHNMVYQEQLVCASSQSEFYGQPRNPDDVCSYWELRGTAISHAINDTLSDAKQLDGKLWFLDGQTLLCYDGEDVKKASDIAFVPTVTISKDPTGGGVTYQPVNMIGEMRRDSFLGRASVTVYQLSFANLSPAPVTARRLDSSGNWVQLSEGALFSVNRVLGQVTFSSAPGVSPVTGEDNVVVTYGVINEGYVSRINKCRFAICYGANGGADRLFISGNPDFQNYDFYSQLNDPSYFGDLWYGVLGQSHSPIMGYSIIFDQLATHKLNDDDDRNVILRYGTLIEEEGGSDISLTSSLGVRFAVTGVIQGAGAVSLHGFGYSKEPIFLTAEGICAVTPYEYVSERYVQNRSAYLNMVLREERGLENAYSCVYDDFYMLAVNGKVYILDTLEVTHLKETGSRYQYDAYLWDDIPARVMYSFDRKLYFGTDDGRIYQFFDDKDSITSYMDFSEEPYSGVPVKARWDFDFSGDDFYKNKRIRYIAVKLAAHVMTSVEVWARIKGEWRLLIGDSGGLARYFSYPHVCYSKFSYSGNINPRTIGKKVKIKKVDSVRFSIRNEQGLEPFGIFEIALEYTEAGNYKDG